MTCVKCGLLNLPSAEKCDCGHDLASRTTDSEVPASVLTRILTLGAAFALAPLFARAVGLLGPGYPTMTTPLPFPWVWFAWTYGWLFVPVPSIFFCFWCRPLFSGVATGQK